jgi:hypothetical protein
MTRHHDTRREGRMFTGKLFTISFLSSCRMIFYCIHAVVQPFGVICPWPAAEKRFNFGWKAMDEGPNAQIGTVVVYKKSALFVFTVG